MASGVVGDVHQADGAEQQRGGELGTDIVPVSQQEAERIAAGLAHRYWPPDAAQLPWVTAAYPPATPTIAPTGP